MAIAAAGSFAGQSAAATGAAGATGSASMGLAALAGPVGIGLMAASFLSGSGLFGGKKKGKTYVPTYSPEGKEVFKTLHTSILEGKYPESLSAFFIGDEVRKEGLRRKTAKKSFFGAGFRDPESGVGGGVARGYLSETATRLGAAGAGESRAGAAKREFGLRRLSNLQNIINLESSKPVSLMQANLIGKEQKQLAGARTGAGLGTLATLAAIGLT